MNRAGPVALVLAAASLLTCRSDDRDAAGPGAAAGSSPAPAAAPARSPRRSPRPLSGEEARELEDALRQLGAGRYDEARASLERIARATGDRKALAYLGEIYRRQRSYRAGRATFESLSDLLDEPEATFLAGFFAAELGDRDAAVARYRQALASDPQHRQSLRHLGTWGLATGRVTEALAEIEPTARQLQPPDPTLQNVIGLLLRKSGRLDDAVAAFETGLRYAPDRRSTMLRTNLGRALADLNRLDEAAGHLEAVLATDPDQLIALYALANVRFRQGRREQGQALMVRFQEQQRLLDELTFEIQNLSYYPEEPSILVRVGKLYERRGEPDKAATYYRRALARAPDDPEARQALERLGGVAAP